MPLKKLSGAHGRTGSRFARGLAREADRIAKKGEWDSLYQHGIEYVDKTLRVLESDQPDIGNVTPHPVNEKNAWRAE